MCAAAGRNRRLNLLHVPSGLLVPRTGRVIALEWARTPLQRARGLLARPPLGPGEALVFQGARQVHTFGMRYAIDVCFCDGDLRVLLAVEAMKPWRITRWVRGARYAIEARAGELSGVRAGDQLSFVDRSDR